MTTTASTEKQVKKQVAFKGLKRATAQELPVIHYNDGSTSIEGPATGDSLDRLLQKLGDAEDPLIFTDPQTGEKFKLTREERTLLERIEQGVSGDKDFDPFQPYVDFFTQDRMRKPLVNRTEPKRRFMVSKWETMKIQKLVRAIRRGFIKPVVGESTGTMYYDIWSAVDEDETWRKRVHVPAPKLPLPGHELSYNPPAEYLPDAEETAAWNALPEEEQKKKPLPKKYSALRQLPLYDRLVQERFARCLDLYLCPRQVKNKIDIADPDSILPELPSPDSLKPYPAVKSTEFTGHEGPVQVSCHPSGQWLASGGVDGTVRVWDTVTGRCVSVMEVGECQAVAWCPNPEVVLLAAAVGEKLLFIVPQLPGSEQSVALVKGHGSGTAVSVLNWTPSTMPVVCELKHPCSISTIAWHSKGDYLACMMPTAPTLASSVIMHQLSRRTSQQPFGKLPSGQARSLAFSPAKPLLAVATAQNIRLYDLLKQRLVKKLAVPNITSIAFHSGGDNLLAGTADSKVSWFDCDLSSSPYKTLQVHSGRVNAVCYHPEYPIFASAGDDCTIQVFHGRVYEELDKTALIVPVKVLGVNERVTSVVFHPTQPWLYAGDASGLISLYV